MIWRAGDKFDKSLMNRKLKRSRATKKSMVLSSVIVQNDYIKLLDVVVEKNTGPDCMLKLLKAGFGDLDTEEIRNSKTIVLNIRLRELCGKKFFGGGKG